MKRFTSLVLAFLLLLCPAAQAAESKTVPESATVLQALCNYILRNYQFEVDQGDLLNALITSVLNEQDDEASFEFLADSLMSALDDHSLYFTPDETREFNEYVDAAFAGVGVSLVMIDGYCTIMSILDNTPAVGSGLVPGDKIIAVNGENVQGMDIDLIINRVRGEVGTDVTLTILSEDGAVWDCVVNRQTVVTPSVEYVVNADEDVAYLIISQFAADTAAQFVEKYNEIREMGIQKLVIDLRSNTGGYTQQAYEIASIFLPQGSIVFQEYMRAYNAHLPTKSKNAAPDLTTELIVLTNEYTASASEILTAALKENNRAVVIGTNTFGKGTMQTVTGMGDYGSVKLTIAEFTSPNGNKINGVGIAPDIAVENTKKRIEDSDLIPLSLRNKYALGDEAEEVCAIKQRLYYLGFYSGDLESPVYDKALELAVSRFQESFGLYPYGVSDINTQLTLQTEVKRHDMVVDKQLERAFTEMGTTAEAF